MTELRNLVQYIKENRMKLPEMQRDYVWKSTQVRDLLDSLYRKYPSGTILRWATTERVPTREFAIDQQEDKTYLSYYLLLDGQQRLTSLSSVLKGEEVKVRDHKRPIDIYFNLDHPDKLQNLTKVSTDDDNTGTTEDEEEAQVNKLNEFNERTFIVSNPLVRNQPNWISVTEAFRRQYELFEEVRERIDSMSNLSDEEKKAKRQKWSKRYQNLLKIEEYDFQVCELPASLSYEEVTEIFVRVNSSGTKLKGSDLALAQITSKWRSSADEKGALKEFEALVTECQKFGWEVSIGIIVRALVSILTGQSRFKVVGEMTKEELQSGWKQTRKSFVSTIDYMKNTLGLENEEMLSSPYFMVLLAFLHDKKNYTLTDEENSLIKKWFLIANAKGRYSRGSSESMLDQDLFAVKNDNLTGLLDNLQAQFGRLDFTSSDFENKTTNSGIFKTMFTLMRYYGALDWSTKQLLSMNNLAIRNQIEYHHIFPQNFLKDTYDKKEIYDIANFTFIVKRTNVLISDEDPAKYLPIVLDQCGEENFKKHCIPTDRELWQIDRYKDFIQERRRLLLEMVNNYLKELG